MSHDDWIRILRYLDGGATPAERAETERWLDADPARRDSFEAARAVHEAASGAEPPAAPAGSGPANWAAVRREMRRPAPGTRRSSDREAARPVRRRWAVPTGIAAAAVLAAGLWAAVLTPEGDPDGRKVWTTGPGESREVVLADGSRVVLSQESMFIQFHPAHRRFALEGAALFEVVPDPDRPFSVSTAQGGVQALSTTFAVRARAGEETMFVSVEEGRVGLTATIELYPSVGDIPAKLTLGAGESAQAGAWTWPVQVEATLEDILATSTKGQASEEDQTSAEGLTRPPLSPQPESLSRSAGTPTHLPPAIPVRTRTSRLL
ncbi:MAG: FecR domain-containing protein [Bacteroidota bacterium]